MSVTAGEPMSATPSELFALARTMKADGAPLRDVVQELLHQDATQLDIVRVVMSIENVDVRRARELISTTGLFPSDKGGLTVVIPKDDPWHEEIFRPGSSEMTPPEIDPDLVFQGTHCNGLHYLVGNPHIRPGRMAAWCEEQQVEITVSLKDMAYISSPAKYWINGFLAGNEPSPPGSHDSAGLTAWESARRTFRATGEWPSEIYQG